MALLAVMARYRVTQGAGVRVPISGATGCRLLGQVTSAGSLSTGTARSEPHRVPGTGRRAGSGSSRRGGRPGGGRGVPGVQGARVGATCAHHTRWNECIYGVPSRPGQGRASVINSAGTSTRTSARTVQ